MVRARHDVPVRLVRFHPEGAAGRGEVPPRPDNFAAYPHVIDGLGAIFGG